MYQMHMLTKEKSECTYASRPQRVNTPNFFFRLKALYTFDSLSVLQTYVVYA